MTLQTGLQARRHLSILLCPPPQLLSLAGHLLPLSHDDLCSQRTWSRWLPQHGVRKQHTGLIRM